MELVMLIICGALTITTSLMVILARNTVHSALWMVASFFCMAIIFLLLHAQFLAILQVIVYAGAIMMFIIYAIMVLNLRQEEEGRGSIPATKSFGLLLLVGLFIGIMVLGVNRGYLAMQGPLTDQLFAQFGQVTVLANFLFSDYLLPFEVASLLLTAGVVGAVVLTKRR